MSEGDILNDLLKHLNCWIDEYEKDYGWRKSCWLTRTYNLDDKTLNVNVCRKLKIFVATIYQDGRLEFRNRKGMVVEL